MSEYYFEAICPVCGRAIGKIYYPKPWETEGKIPPSTYKQMKKIRLGMDALDFFNEYLIPNYDLNRSYWGIVRETGKGRMTILRYLENPEDNPELFNGLKQALKLALEHYLNKEWISKEEIEEILERY